VATVRPTMPVGASGPTGLDPEIVALMADIHASRVEASARSLSASPAASGRTTGTPAVASADSAASWLYGQLEALNGLQGNQVLVEYEPATANAPQGARTVLATLPGIARWKRIVYVLARLDGGEAPAGGTAADSGSATSAAALLELARVMAMRRWDATIRFAAFPGGTAAEDASRQHALGASGLGLPVVAVVDLDLGTVASSADASSVGAQVVAHAAAPGDGPSLRLVRLAQLLGLDDTFFPAVLAVGDNELGAAQPFAEVGYAALRLSIATQTTTPVPAQASARQVAADGRAAALQAAFGLIADLALAPAAPLQPPVVEPEPDRPAALRLRWDPVAGSGVSGYWVAAWMPGSDHFESVTWVGKSAVLSLDGVASGSQFVYAVAAADDLGHASPFGPEVSWRFE
jgi:hypothetical protein